VCFTRVSDISLTWNSAPESASDGLATEAVSKPVESAPSAAPPAAAVDAIAQEDEEVKDKTDLAPEKPDTATDDPALEANGTPATRKGSNGKRKSGGVPEHKNKKLNKKKSMPKITNLDAKPGDYFLARLKSYPPWPSIICDEEILPEVLLTTRPVTTKKADGTYNEAYADGGKKVADRTFPVMFLATNEL
jgi:PWWP domain